MAIQSAFTRTSYSPADTQQRKVLHPISTPKSQPLTEPNLSYTSQAKQSVPIPKAKPKINEKSTKRFALRLTQRQRNQIKRLQKSWGLSTESAVVKKLIDDSNEENNSNDLARQVKELAEIKAELNRIGININQIAKNANQVQMSMDDLNAVTKYMSEVCEVIYGKGLK